MYNIFAFLLCVQKINQHFVNYIWVEHVFEELTALFVMFVGREQSFANTGWGTYVKREMIVNFYMNMIWLKCQCVTFSKSLANVTTGIANICTWMQIPWRSMTVHGMIVDFVNMVSLLHYYNDDNLLPFSHRTQLPQQTYQTSIMSKLSLWFLPTWCKV